MYTLAGFLSKKEFEANGDIVEFYFSGAWHKVTNSTESTKSLEDWLTWINTQATTIIGDIAEFQGLKSQEYLSFYTEEPLVTKMRFLNEYMASSMGYIYNVELESDGSISSHPFSRKASLWGSMRLIVQGAFQTRYSILAECDLVESPYKNTTKYIVGYGAISDYSNRKDFKFWNCQSVYVHEDRKIDITNFKEGNCKGIHQQVESFGIAKLQGLSIQVEFRKGQDLKTTEKQLQLGDFRCGVLEVS